MTVHQCPECVLRFATKTELEWHLREEHPTFRHDYPAQVHEHPAPEHIRASSPWTRMKQAGYELLFYFKRSRQ
ncbi:MAG: hypothetical protein JWN35_1783 [Frankiales bacterium]|jgi:hypothetical protein|nr:hypothetical protein [Frankiales bacterium]